MLLRLHWSPDSANIVIRMALEELGLDYEAVRIDRSANGLRNAAFLKLNPQGLIPVLEDGDLVLFETGAILVHLAERTGRLGADGPDASDPKARAAFLKWMFFLSNTVHADCRAMFYTDRYVGDPAAIPTVHDGLAKRHRAHMAMLESEISPNGWLVADKPTLVDLYLAACLRWLRLYPAVGPLFTNDDIAPKLSAMLAALEARPAVQRAYELEHMTGHPLTAPERPDLPPDQITG